MRRPGLQQAIKIASAFCVLYQSKSATMIEYIENVEYASDEQKVAAINALQACDAACDALAIFKRFFEP